MTGGMTMPDDKAKTDVEEAIEELIEDPDAPEKGDADKPPQTIDAEPTSLRR